MSQRVYETRTGLVRFLFSTFFLYIYSRCSYRTRKKLWEVVRGKNVVVNVDGGFQYSGNYVVTAGVFLGYLPNEDFSVESKKNYLIQGMVIMLRAVDSSNQFFSILFFFFFGYLNATPFARTLFNKFLVFIIFTYFKVSPIFNRSLLQQIHQIYSSLALWLIFRSIVQLFPNPLSTK